MYEIIVSGFIAYIIFKMYKSFENYKKGRGRNEMLIIEYSKQIENNPLNPRPYYLRGICHQELSNFRLAVDDFTKALENNINNNEFKFENSAATFDNITILRSRSQAKKSLGDKYAAEQDIQMINEMLT